MAMTDGRGSRSRVYAADWVYAELGCWRNPPAAQQRFDMYGMLARGHYHFFWPAMAKKIDGLTATD